jgi:hypothetical protein
MKKDTFPQNNISTSDVASQTLEVLQYWNTLPYFSAHKDPSKKNYNMALWCLKTLMEGRAVEKMDFDDDFIADNGITNIELNHKFTVEEIKAAIDKYSFMSSPEYIADKSKWSRSLDYFIYNQVTKRSFFWTLTGGREIPGTPEKPLDPKIFEHYKNHFFYGHTITVEQNQAIIKSVNYVVMQQRAYQEKVCNHYHQHPLKDFEFYRMHKQYVDLEVRDRDDFTAKHLGAYTFGKFPAWLMDMHGIEYDVSAKEIERAKEKYIRDEIKIKQNTREEEKRNAEREIWLKNRGKNKYQV